MSELMIAKQQPLALDEAQRAILRQTLFGSVDGLGEADKKGWRRFWNRVLKAEIGELFTVALVFRRNPKFHRKFFALLNFGYEHWEPKRHHKTYKGQPVAKNFEQFREDITIAAGYYVQTFDLDGRMRIRAKSIAFDKMEDDEFDRLYNSVADVLLARVVQQYAGREELDMVVAEWSGFVS